MSSFVTVEVDTRDSYDISLQFAISDTRMQVAEMYGVSLRDINGNCLRCGAPENEPDETCSNCERTTPTRYVCPDCGSPHLLQDAYVPINDPSDIRLFDAVLCDACGISKVTPKESLPEEVREMLDDITPLDGLLDMIGSMLPDSAVPTWRKKK